MSGQLQRILFAPPWWAIVLNPHFLPRRALHAAMRRAGPELAGRVLDVGCGTQPYRSLLTAADEIVALDVDTPSNRALGLADAYYDGVDLPFADGTFGGVLCSQVLEHVFAPERMLAEIARVLEPGGTLVLSVPFAWPEHEQPNDSQRFTSFGLAARLDAAGFELLRHERLVTGGAALCALAADSMNVFAARLWRALRLLFRALAIAPVSLLGVMLDGRRSPPLYLDNFVVARRRP